MNVGYGPETPAAFVRHLALCCALSEQQLRRWLRDRFERAGFRWETDEYEAAVPRHEVCNARAVRGQSVARVALVVHTDVCREHAGSPRAPRIVERLLHDGARRRRALQDETCEVQIGGDDRCGVAIATWVALHSSLPVVLYFATDEELGLLSSRVAPAAFFAGIELAVGLDRGNASDEIVTNIAGVELCSFAMLDCLLGIAAGCGSPRSPVSGGRTDVLSLRQRNLVSEAVNLTVGYHDSCGPSGREFIDLVEAWETARYVRAVLEQFA